MHAATDEFLISPQPSDVVWLRLFKFEDLTQSETLEFCSVCEQPEDCRLVYMNFARL